MPTVCDYDVVPPAFAAPPRWAKMISRHPCMCAARQGVGIVYPSASKLTFVGCVAGAYVMIIWLECGILRLT